MSLAEAIGNSVDLLGKEFKVLKSYKVHFGSVLQLQICNIFYNIILKINIVHTCFVFKHCLKDTNISNYFDIFEKQDRKHGCSFKRAPMTLDKFSS